MKRYINMIISCIFILLFLSQKEELPMYYVDHKELIDETSHTPIQDYHIINKPEPQVPPVVTPTKKTNQSTIKTSQQKAKPSEEIFQDNTTLFSFSQIATMRSIFLTLINNERNLPVTFNNSLIQSTTIRAKEAYTKWSHTRPDQSRWDTTLANIIDIHHVLHGENLARIEITYKDHYTDEELKEICHLIHKGLRNSSTHYAVMTNSNYKKVNIGIYSILKNQSITITIAQHFTE